MKRSPVTPSLYAPDLPAALRHHVDVPGFRQTGSYRDEDGAEIWAEVALGEARIRRFCGALPDRPEPVLCGLIDVFVDDIDAVATRLRGRVPFDWGPETQDYGLRELAIRDLNGYYRVFARDP